ncbi:hypothetical protein ACFL2Q_20380 [Thermodesulfobacteriota bacterium]
MQTIDLIIDGQEPLWIQTWGFHRWHSGSQLTWACDHQGERFPGVVAVGRRDKDVALDAVRAAVSDTIRDRRLLRWVH